MKFKKATIDYRWSRETGHDVSGRYLMGLTYYPRRIENLYPGQRIVLEEGQTYDYLEIDTNREGEGAFDAHIFMSQRPAYTFTFNGQVKDDYTVVRFYMDGFYWIFEYRLISRENS